MPEGPPAALGAPPVGETGEGQALLAAATRRRSTRRPLGVVFWICASWVALMAALAVFASLLHLTSPTAQNYSAVQVGPGVHHLFGTDDLGRDLLSRVIFGSRVSLVVGFAPIAVGLLVGGSLGLWAAFRGKAADAVVSAVSFTVLAYPALLAIIVIQAFWLPRALWKLVIIFSVIASALLFVVVRAAALSYVNREFVLAAKAMGARTHRILLRELLPNVVPATAAFALIGVATAIILEGSLAYLGLSVSLPTPSLGNLINEGTGQNLLQSDPWITLWPALYIFLLLIALNLMADRLRAAFDVGEGRL